MARQWLFNFLVCCMRGFFWLVVGGFLFCFCGVLVCGFCCCFGLFLLLFFLISSFLLTVGWITGSPSSGLDPARLHNMSQLLQYFIMQMLADFTKTFFFNLLNLVFKRKTISIYTGIYFF